KLLALETVDFTANTRHLAMVRVATGERTRLLPLPSNVVPAFAFSQDGARFACLSEDPETASETLRLWDTEALEPAGSVSFGLQYHAIALNWPTRRLAAVGGGRCDIVLIHE
ncbi:MAG: hypothetical protein M1436_09925, partial [Acidobacteria bacterium]|nr:hypothetical protein [Acidobacteriota bacterium]